MFRGPLEVRLDGAVGHFVIVMTHDFLFLFVRPAALGLNAARRGLIGQFLL
jgi:hypothetical protein